MARNSRKKGIEQEADTRYGSYAAQLCDWVDTTNMVVIGGRGMAKSTVIMASRSERCVRLMPGAPVAIVANTYANLIDNIMPAVQNGWRLLGLIEGVHYINAVKLSPGYLDADFSYPIKIKKCTQMPSNV